MNTSPAERELTADTIRDLPIKTEARLRQNDRAMEQFKALPLIIQDRLAELCDNLTKAREQRMKPAIIGQIRDVVAEYFDGVGTIFELLCEMNDQTFRKTILEADGNTVTVSQLTEKEAAAVDQLPGFIDMNPEGDLREKQIVALIRLVQKSGQNSFPQKKAHGLVTDWPTLRKKWIAIATADLIPEFLKTETAASSEQASGNDVTAEIQSLADVTAGNAALTLANDDDDDDVGFEKGALDLDSVSDRAEETSVAPTEDRVLAPGRDEENATNGENSVVDESATTTAENADGEGDDTVPSETGNDSAETQESRGEPLPEFVKQKLETLMAEYFQAGGRADGHIPAPAQKVLIEMFRLVREYTAFLKPLEATGRGATQILKYMKKLNIPMLDEVETKVLAKLTEKMPTDPRAGRMRFSPAEKSMLAAATRLRRKQGTNVEVGKWWKEEMAINNVVQRHKILQEHATLATRDLVPDIYLEVEKELGLHKEAEALAEAPETEDVQPNVDAASDVVSEPVTIADADTDAMSAADANTPDAAEESPVKVVEASLPPSEADDLVVAAETLAASLPHAEGSVQDQRLALARELLERSNALLDQFAKLPEQEQRFQTLEIIAKTHGQIAHLLDGQAATQLATTEAIQSEPGVTFRTQSGGTVTLSKDLRGMVIVLDGNA